MLDDSYNSSVKFYGIVLDGSNKNGYVPNERGQNHKKEISGPSVSYCITFNAIFSFVTKFMIKGRHSDQSLSWDVLSHYK